MPVDRNAAIEVTAFKWVPDFARGFVRDIRVRWALEEIDLPYRVRLIGGPDDRPADYVRDQPFDQVPVYKESALSLFESGAILIHIGDKDERLLPRDTVGRMRAIAWLIAALNSIEPYSGQLNEIDLFAGEAEWAKRHRPDVVDSVAKRLGQVSNWLGDKEWLEDRFTIGDLMMIEALRGVSEATLLARFPNLIAYVERGKARPGFGRAMDAQLADFVALEDA